MSKVSKLITRSVSCPTMGDRIRKRLGAKTKNTIGGHNQVLTSYRGKRHGIEYVILCTATRHMGDFTELHVERDNFPSMAALIHFYRDIKAELLGY